MWEKVLEVLSGLWLRTPEQRAERRAKQNLVFLHQRLLDCTAAYDEHRTEKTQDSFIQWADALERLRDAIVDAHLVLAALSPKAYDLTMFYAQGETSGLAAERFAGNPAFEDDVTFARNYYRLRRLISGTQTDKEVTGEFEAVSVALLAVIGKHLTPGEIQQAQEEYAKQTAPKESRWF
jgi:hypothetical protein